MAARDQYFNPGTLSQFRDSGGDVVFTMASLGSGAGRQSAQLDFGAGDRPVLYRYRGFVRFNTTPVVGERVGMFLKTSDNTNLDNDDGTGDLAVSAEDKLRNLQIVLRSIVVDEAATSVTFSRSGLVLIPSRIIQVVFWNYAADALSSTAADNGFDLEEMPLNQQP